MQSFSGNVYKNSKSVTLPISQQQQKDNICIHKVVTLIKYQHLKVKTFRNMGFYGEKIQKIDPAYYDVTLRKHAYSNILKILPPKNGNFSDKKF